jgi:hypothetical protein
VLCGVVVFVLIIFIFFLYFSKERPKIDILNDFSSANMSIANIPLVLLKNCDFSDWENKSLAYLALTSKDGKWNHHGKPQSESWKVVD